MRSTPEERTLVVAFDWNPDELALDRSLLESIRQARLSFGETVSAASGCAEPKHLVQLRSEPAYQMAEFLYSLRVYGIEAVEDLDRFVGLHNDYVVSLTRDAAKLRRLGLTEERALASMFTADTRPRLLQNWKERPGAIDQSNLARFLVAVMSTETCRKILIDFELAGFIKRERSPYGTVVVWSTGTVERIFGEMLRDLRRDLMRMHMG